MAEENAVQRLVGAFHDDETPATEEIQKLVDDVDTFSLQFSFSCSLI